MPTAQPRPVLVRLDPTPEAAPSRRPPVRIFVGTTPDAFRAERILVWSVARHRDPARRYDVYLVPARFRRWPWERVFYTVPALAGHAGRAIYNDVDQVYWGDPAKLFDREMNGAAILSPRGRETSAMLLDCARLESWWSRAEPPPPRSHGTLSLRLRRAGLWQDALTPCRPRIRASAYWQALEREADRVRFSLFSSEQPSRRYRELLALYARLHDDGRPTTGHSAASTFSGVSLREHVDPIGRLVREHGVRTLLDYGAGKASLYLNAPGEPETSRHKIMPAWGDVRVTCYDPGYAPFAAPHAARYDGVICTDVLEHIPAEDIGWVLNHLFATARRFVYAVAACYPAKKILPDGSNAHCTVRPPAWWAGQMRLAAQAHPHVAWTLCTQEKSLFALGQRNAWWKPGIHQRFFGGRAGAP